MGSYVTDFFVLRYGVRQGGVLSFAVYVDNVFECVSDCGLDCSIKRYCMSIFRSTHPSRPNNVGLKMSVHPSVHKKFLRFQWNLVCM